MFANSRSLAHLPSQLVIEKAKVAPNRVQRAADRKVIAERKPISKEFKQTLKD